MTEPFDKAQVGVLIEAHRVHCDQLCRQLAYAFQHREKRNFLAALNAFPEANANLYEGIDKVLSGGIVEIPPNSPTWDEIRAVRLKYGLTQTQAAEVLRRAIPELNTSRNTWAKWESGENRMQPEYWAVFVSELKKTQVKRKTRRRR